MADERSKADMMIDLQRQTLETMEHTRETLELTLQSQRVQERLMATFLGMFATSKEKETFQGLVGAMQETTDTKPDVIPDSLEDLFPQPVETEPDPVEEPVLTRGWDTLVTAQDLAAVVALSEGGIRNRLSGLQPVGKRPGSHGRLAHLYRLHTVWPRVKDTANGATPPFDPDSCLTAKELAEVFDRHVRSIQGIVTTRGVKMVNKKRPYLYRWDDVKNVIQTAKRYNFRSKRATKKESTDPIEDLKR